MKLKLRWTGEGGIHSEDTVSIPNNTSSCLLWQMNGEDDKTIIDSFVVICSCQSIGGVSLQLPCYSSALEY